MIIHTPVLLEEVIQSIPDACSFVLDGTLGHGGHSMAMAKYLQEKGNKPKIVGIDRDDSMLQKAQKRVLEQDLGGIVQGFHLSYADLVEISNLSEISQFDFMLLDLGVNMEHFKDGKRGFSIKRDGPLDMRFDTSSGEPVRVWLTKATFDDHVRLFEQYTDFDEKYREWIARELVSIKRKTPFATTGDVRTWTKRVGISDKVLSIMFQTWRIYINDELKQLEDFLQIFVKFLSIGGRCGIMSYHSGEDKIVKYRFKELVDNSFGNLYNKKVIVPNRKEQEANKASRSAKYRVFEKSGMSQEI